MRKPGIQPFDLVDNPIYRQGQKWSCLFHTHSYRIIIGADYNEQIGSDRRIGWKGRLKETEASDIVNLIFDGFTETLKKVGRIEIRGFGSFTIRHYDSYPGRNPKTGKRIRVGDKRLPFFNVGKGLKERVNNR
jgi:integration host factor subunit beta